MKRRWAAALALILSLSMGCLQVLPAYAAQETSGQTSDEGQPDPAPPDSDSETSPPAGPDQTGDPSGSEALPAQTPPEAASDNPDQTQTEGDPSNPQPDPSEPVDENKNPAEQTHGKTEYEASLGTNTVRIHCSQDAFPAGTVLEAKPLSANLPELQKLSSDEGMSAFGLDIQFLSEDGKIIEPAVPVQAEITVSADEFSSEIEASGIRLFHAETDGLKQVETSSMKLEDGKIKAVFTADSFSPFIFQARTKEKSEEEAKPDEETADAADQKDQPQAQSEDPEPEINNLYCYTLIPGMTFNPQVIANAEWNGMGVGEVLGLPAPQLPSGTSKTIFMTRAFRSFIRLNLDSQPTRTSPPLPAKTERPRPINMRLREAAMNIRKAITPLTGTSSLKQAAPTPATTTTIRLFMPECRLTISMA